MGTSNLKEIVEQIDTTAKEYIQIIQRFMDDTKFIAWCKFHGWDISDIETSRLIARQAILNAVIRQAFPCLTFFDTPFDFINAPDSLVSRIYETAKHSQLFNFWGELYSTLIPQRYRRHIGQFWTDELIAEWMVAWLIQFQPKFLVDVGCGAGNFLVKATRYLQNGYHDVKLCGLDFSPLLLNITQATFSTHHLPLPNLVMKDYLELSLPADVDAIVCNPPYTRHHYIAPDVKDRLQRYVKGKFNIDISRKATMAFYFLMKLIAEMHEGTYAAVIVPMEVLDASYGNAVKHILSEQTVLSAIINFSQKMNAFYGVNVGASILLFKKGYEKGNIVHHVTLDTLPTTKELLSCLDSTASHKLPFGNLVTQPQTEILKIPKWFSITSLTPEIKKWKQTGLVVPLKTLAKIVRGIATGANEFFVLPTYEVRQRNLESYVIKTIQRNREIQDIMLDEAAWENLSDEGKRVWLLYLNDINIRNHPEISAYISEGELKGYNQRSLVQTRKQWYLMEKRDIPPIFFTILTRGNPRFILNKAGVRPLNMFILLYPNSYIRKENCIEQLWALLNSTFSLSRLHSISRNYGGNTLKVEPRELDNLPVINPLVLSDKVRIEIKGLINDFYRHRDITVFLKEVDALVGTLLNSNESNYYHSSLPVQLQLVES
ncbi:MAG TPA: N-6 DNA methylase [Candidatus Hydrogenedens sp.]|nr:N-6 DNA methylase [Candidatus Hydrogenedens sp.]